MLQPHRATHPREDQDAAEGDDGCLSLTVPEPHTEGGNRSLSLTVPEPHTTPRTDASASPCPSRKLREATEDSASPLPHRTRGRQQMPHLTPAWRESFPHPQVLSIVKDFAMGWEIMEFHLGTLLGYYCRHHQQYRHSDSDSHCIHYY